MEGYRGCSEERPKSNKPQFTLEMMNLVTTPLLGQETQLRDPSLSWAIYVATVHHNPND